MNIKSKVLVVAIATVTAIGNLALLASPVKAASYTWSYWSSWTYVTRTISSAQCYRSRVEINRHPSWRVPLGPNDSQRAGMNARIYGTSIKPGCRIVFRSRARYALNDTFWQVVDYQTEYYSFLMLYAMRMEGYARYNFSEVWAMGNPSCYVRWAVGVSISQRRCDIWNDGGKFVQYMEPSADWWVSLVHDGVPIGQTIFARIDIFINGWKCCAKGGWR